MRNRLTIATALLAALGSAVGAQDIGLELGTKPAAAKVETLDGKPLDLGDYVGKTPMLLEFWAVWCSSCAELEPNMKAMHAKYGERVKFVGVAVSVNQTPGRVKAYVDRHALPWDQVYDRRGAASDAYDAPATSYVVVLDGAGKVVYTGLGGKQDLEGAIRKALASN